MDFEEMAQSQELELEKLNERALLYLAKGMMSTVEVLNGVNMFLRIQKLNSEKAQKFVEEQIKSNQKEISNAIRDIELICDEIQGRGFEVPELI